MSAAYAGALGSRPARGHLLRWACLETACILCLLMPRGAQGAYFYVEEGQEKCFKEHILFHQVLRMTYSMHDKEVLEKDKATHSDCKILMRNPEGKVVKEHALVSDNHQGVLAHAAQVGGEHSICMTCQPQAWFGRRKMRWSIAFDVLGEESTVNPNLETAASMVHIQGTQVGVEELIERISAISTENDYEKGFEGQFVRTSDAVNTDVAAFKLVQVLLITIVTAFQIHHLSRFLQRQRIFDCGGCLPFKNFV
mmetsp:Transcript_107977/g.196546  ORF Transcript_107977/g.196546 Transcript_107977/m.196546 type:complete len:253 (-) Transcript_107977:45-803(-)